MTRASLAWVGVAGLLGACALLGWPVAREAIDWQPALAFSQPWRAFSAVGVHYSVAHLVGNLAGVALAGLFGVVAQLPARMAWAWLVAWPLTQFGLLVRPDLAHYGGLSGVVHAGVAAVAAYLLVAGTRAQRWVSGIVLVGLCAKLLSESPWGPALRHTGSWDFAVAPMAHVTGVVAGALAGAFVALFGVVNRRA